MCIRDSNTTEKLKLLDLIGRGSPDDCDYCSAKQTNKQKLLQKKRILKPVVSIQAQRHGQCLAIRKKELIEGNVKS